MEDYCVNVDSTRLSELGFTYVEIGILQDLVANGVRITKDNLQYSGFTYEQSERLYYAYRICCGAVQVGTEEEIIRHFKKMFGKKYRISIKDLSFNKVAEIPRVAVVYGIDKEPYTIWNSSRYKGKNAIYRVVDSSSKTITIETSRKPRLKYGTEMELSGVLKIKEVTYSGNVIVQFNREYVKMCSRFVIVASLRYPESHIGLYKIICFEGTRVYIFAKNIGSDKNVRYNWNNQRVYDYGIMPSDINKKLKKAANEIYNRLGGKTMEFEGANSDYNVIERDENNMYDENCDINN